MTTPASGRAAIILAGGRSRRMGADKWSLPFGPETLLERTARVLAEAVNEIVIVAREGQEIVVPPGCRLVHDPQEGLGPLAGLAAGLEAVKAERAFLASCDLPFLRSEVARRLLDFAGDHGAAIPRVEGKLMVTSAAYSASVLPVARELLASGERRLAVLAAMAATRLIEPHDLLDIDPDLQSFRNLNTPEQYLAALAEAGLSV